VTWLSLCPILLTTAVRAVEHIVCVYI